MYKHTVITNKWDIALMVSIRVNNSQSHQICLGRHFYHTCYHTWWIFNFDQFELAHCILCWLLATWFKTCVLSQHVFMDGIGNVCGGECKWEWEGSVAPWVASLTCNLSVLGSNLIKGYQETLLSLLSTG